MIGSNPRLAATYTEHASTTRDKLENRSKARARNQRCLHLYHAIL